MQARYEVDQAFRVGGKMAQRKVDVGQSVREGDGSRCSTTSTTGSPRKRRASSIARRAQARQAESDRKRLESLKADGSVSVADEEQAHSRAQQTQAAAEADERKLELARNKLKYTVLRARAAAWSRPSRSRSARWSPKASRWSSIATQASRRSWSTCRKTS